MQFVCSSITGHPSNCPFDHNPTAQNQNCEMDRDRKTGIGGFLPWSKKLRGKVPISISYVYIPFPPPPSTPILISLNTLSISHPLVLFLEILSCAQSACQQKYHQPWSSSRTTCLAIFFHLLLPPPPPPPPQFLFISFLLILRFLLMRLPAAAHRLRLLPLPLHSLVFSILLTLVSSNSLPFSVLLKITRPISSSLKLNLKLLISQRQSPLIQPPTSMWNHKLFLNQATISSMKNQGPEFNHLGNRHWKYRCPAKNPNGFSFLTRTRNPWMMILVLL